MIGGRKWLYICAFEVLALSLSKILFYLPRGILEQYATNNYCLFLIDLVLLTKSDLIELK